MSQVQQESIDSYHAFDPEELGREQRRILMVIKRNGPITDREIAIKAQLPRHSICGRRNELVELGLVRRAGTKYDAETLRNVITWEATRRVN